MMKKRFYALLLCMAVLSIGGCSNENKRDEPSGDVPSDSGSAYISSQISETNSPASSEIVNPPGGNTDNEIDFEYSERRDGTVQIQKYLGHESEVVIPAAINGKPVIKISSAFDDNPNLLISVTVSEGIETLGGGTFENCSKLMSVSLPNSLISIDTDTFRGCESLESIIIPDSVEQLGKYAFAACFGLKTIIMPDSVSIINSDLFNSCTSLESVILSANITEIPDSAFAFCSSLKSVDIPEGVTHIGDAAFYECTSLQRVSLPDSLTEFAKTAFTGCDDLVLIYKGEEYLPERRGELYYALRNAL